MSDVDVAIDFVLRQEDARMSGIITNVPGDKGGRTRFGVAETSHPELTHTGFYDTMSNADALVVARTVYRYAYAAALMLSSIDDQQTSNALLSFAINEGTVSSIKVLQRALQGIDPKLIVDGEFGPGTLAVLNAGPAATVLKLLGVFQRAHYSAIIAANPSDAQFRDGWINRVNQDTTAA